LRASHYWQKTHDIKTNIHTSNFRSIPLLEVKTTTTLQATFDLEADV